MAEATRDGRRLRDPPAPRRRRARACPCRSGRLVEAPSPWRIAMSPRNRSTELMPTAASIWPGCRRSRRGGSRRGPSSPAADCAVTSARQARLVLAGLGVGEPALDVLACRTGGVAGRQTVDIFGPLRAPGAGVVRACSCRRRARWRRDVSSCTHDGPRSLTASAWSRPISRRCAAQRRCRWSVSHGGFLRPAESRSA